MTKEFVLASVTALFLLFSPSAKADDTDPQADAAPAASVVDEAAKGLGARNPTGKRGPWCAAFANFILQKTGHAPMSGDTVGAALVYGPRLQAPKIGAMAVIRTSYGREGHVGFVKDVNPDGSIELISGNWGRKVGDAHIRRRQVVAFVGVD